MANELTERFKLCVEHLKKKQHFPSLRQFSNTIGVHPQCISDIFTGKREVNSDIIQKTFLAYSINPNYIFTGIGDFIFSEDKHKEKDIVQVEKPSISCVLSDYQLEYLQKRTDNDFTDSIPTISLIEDKFSKGPMRAFEVTSDLMDPSLTSGEIVVSNKLNEDKWGKLVNKFVYVFVTDENLLIRRLVNFDSKKSIFTISCDNAFYDEDTLELGSIREIWQVRTTISPFRPSQESKNNVLSQEVDNLRGTITEQSEVINSLNSTIEKMLKQNRRSTAR